MSELLRSRHAFGNLQNLENAISEKLVDSYDILFMKDENGKPVIGWLDAKGEKVILEDKTGVVSVDVLPDTGELETVYICNSKLYFWDGTKFVAPIDEIGEEVNTKIDAAVSDVVGKANAYTDKMVEAAMGEHLTKKYEIADVPAGTLVNYREDEIRVMCPANTEWHLQSVGANGDANTYYMTLKTYAPNDDCVGYREHLGNQVDAETLTDLKVDEYGRKYQPTWLGVAKYDTATDIWSYYGANSTVNRYIGWNYQIDWYNADGVIIASDSIRINLSNEECHYVIEPSYVNDAIVTAKAYTDKQIANAISVIEF